MEVDQSGERLKAGRVDDRRTLLGEAGSDLREDSALHEQIRSRPVGKRRPGDQQSHALSPLNTRYRTAIRMDTPFVT